LRFFLERYGHHVEEAADGEQAIARLAGGESFDLVLMDMRMPGLNGLQTLVQIRQTHKELPVIMVTGYGGMDSAGETLEKGANQYVSKPFKHEELLEAMAKVGLAMEKPALSAGGASSLKIWTAALCAGAVVALAGAWQQGWFSNRDYKLPYSKPTDAPKEIRWAIFDAVTRDVGEHLKRKGISEDDLVKDFAAWRKSHGKAGR